MPAQYTDPAVSRKRFDREISEYHSFGDQYRRQGWFLIEAHFPRVFVVLATSKLNPAAVVMGVKFDYTNYDAAPPSVQIVNPFTGVPYKYKELPSHLNRALPDQEIPLPGIMPEGPKMVIGAAQPYMQAYGDEIPFLCLAGVREYHEHPAHSGDVWELHRTTGAGRLVRILEIIYRYGIDPITGFGVQLVPQVGLNYGPPPS
jgi:hypothetical protein